MQAAIDITNTFVHFYLGVILFLLLRKGSNWGINDWSANELRGSNFGVLWNVRGGIFGLIQITSKKHLVEHFHQVTEEEHTT